MSPLPSDPVIGGRTYSLAHLQPFTVGVTPKADGAPTFKLYVAFGSHVYSKEWDATHPRDHRLDDGREIRCFCPVRHGYSLHLPGIVQAAVGGRAYFSQGRNYLLIENLPGLNAPYAVFFNLEVSRHGNFDAAMFVISAYAKPNLPPKRSLPAITFATLVAKTVRGEKIVKPKK